jgi:hypothetical protein
MGQGFTLGVFYFAKTIAWISDFKRNFRGLFFTDHKKRTLIGDLLVCLLAIVKMQTETHSIAKQRRLL